MRRILVFGRTGQVAAALAAVPPHDDRRYVFLARDEADLTLPATLRAAIDRSRPDLVLNAAAYTAVDKAESEPGLAHGVNAEGPKSLARLCRTAGIPLIHLSTDYVFDGAGGEPYRPGHARSPMSVYGASKARGETEIAAELDEHVIVRLAWVYSATGKNFLTTMLALAEKRDELRVVADQKGSPSFAADLASGLDVIVARVLGADAPQSLWGIYHLTNGGATSWHGFATEIFRLAERHGVRPPRLRPIATRDYPTAARRPPCSVLDTSLTRARFGVDLRTWQEALADCLGRMFGKPEATGVRQAS